jgi:hypothetical protein
LKGVMTLKPFELTTVFGPVRIGIEHIREIVVVSPAEGLLAISARGLALYYPFDRDEGDKVTDASGKGNDGTVNGAVWSHTGKIGGAFAFPGASDCVNAGNRIDLANRDFSLSHWVKRSRHSIATDEYTLSQGQSLSYQGLFTMFRTDNRFGFNFYDAGLYTEPIAADLTGWHHWVCTYLATTRERRIYCDGVFLTKDVVMANYQGKGDLLLGKSWNANNNFDGLLDEVMVFDRALSDAEVKTLYNARKPLAGGR